MLQRYIVKSKQIVRQSYFFWAGFMTHHGIDASRRFLKFSVSGSALLCGTVLMGSAPDAQAAERGEKTRQKMSHCRIQHKDAGGRQVCGKPMVSPETTAAIAEAPVAQSPDLASTVDGGTENLRVYGTPRSYTAPAVEAWGKTLVALKDIPHSISVITQQRMEDSNMLTMTDAMRQLNGIRVLPGSTANSNFYSRGYQLTTSIDNTPNAAGTLNNASFDLSMFDRIEVMRGSAGLLQGAGGAGGVVNQVTKKPGKDFAASGSASVGSFNNYRADIDLTVPLNRSKTLRFRTADVFQDNDYFYKYAHNRMWQAYGALEWDITPSTTFLVSHAAQKQNIDAPYYGLPVTTTRTLWYGGRDANPTPPWGYSNYMTQQTIASLTQKLWGDWSVTARGTFYDQSYNTSYNSPDTPPDVRTGLTSYVDSGTFPYRGTNTSRSADVYATGSFHLLHRTHHLLLGFNYNAYNTHVAYGAVNSDCESWMRSASWPWRVPVMLHAPERHQPSVPPASAGRR